MTMILLSDEFLHGRVRPQRGPPPATIILVAAVVGRLLRSAHGCTGRPHQHALGQVPSLGALDCGPVGCRHGSGLHDAHFAEHSENRLRVRNQHPADDALFHQQHALLGAGRRHDRRCGRAREAQFLPLHRGQGRAIHGRRRDATVGCQIRRPHSRPTTSAGK